MTSPAETKKQASEDSFEKLRVEMKATALFAATGGQDKTGAATIGLTLASIEIPKGFVDGYLPLAPFDVVGMLFAADPRIVERISASEYDKIPYTEIKPTDHRMRLKIRDYLRGAGFEHLVLAGLQSTLYGTAWIVAYRGPANSPASDAFTDEQLEIARYRAPSILFECLRARCGEKGASVPMPAARATGSLVPLDPNRLRIAILEAQGFGASEIAKKVFKAEGSVSNLLTDIHERLGIEGRSITLRDLEHYAGRVG